MLKAAYGCQRWKRQFAAALESRVKSIDGVQRVQFQCKRVAKKKLRIVITAKTARIVAKEKRSIVSKLKRLTKRRTFKKLLRRLRRRRKRRQ